MEWTDIERREVARRIAETLYTESSIAAVDRRRVWELSELIVFALSGPADVLKCNEDKYAGFLTPDQKA